MINDVKVFAVTSHQILDQQQSDARMTLTLQSHWKELGQHVEVFYLATETVYKPCNCDYVHQSAVAAGQVTSVFDWSCQ